MTTAGRSWWGWGLTEEAVPDDQCAALAALLPGLPDHPRPVPDLAGLTLPEPRMAPPPALAGCCSTRPDDRAGHTYGKAYRHVVRALGGDLRPAPDLVAYPRTGTEVTDLLDWAGGANVAVIPYGGRRSGGGGGGDRRGHPPRGPF